MNRLFITFNRISSASARWAFLCVGTALLAAALQSCSMLKNFREGVLHPMTPEESESQVVGAAREIITLLNLKGVSATFSRESCNDQGEAPFRGRVMLDYNHAPTLEESRSEIQRMLTVLTQNGWSGDPNFHSHASNLSKHGVTAEFTPYVPRPDFGDFGGDIEIWGECSDMTTTKDTGPVPIPLDELS